MAMRGDRLEGAGRGEDGAAAHALGLQLLRLLIIIIIITIIIISIMVFSVVSVVVIISIIISSFDFSCTILNVVATAFAASPASSCPAPRSRHEQVHMAHFQLGSFLIGLISNWVRF